ncbi:MAG: DNA topoisomerase (ATP-hydrolyzing) subunit A [Candidatus Marsarchaeota archaeon]|nr:DNA topoisomerase (ATP-hydrolyzing) subunit A [Candidatus Marsarchaeota archaeon]
MTTSYTLNEIVVPRSVEEELKDSYLRYSMSVIVARALPDIRDGLKPSQRRILFAMKQLNLGPHAKYRKCAKICGDTSGDFHPHGEAVIYPTLVRMAQDWVMRYSLVNGQGNFGSIDGDPPAQMRYTEARLTHASVQLMDDLDKDTVDFVPNYDETKKEPVVLPSKFPNLICNGSSGIAVGMATNIPPHNLGEVIKATLLLLDKPTTTIDEIMQVMPGPDFPTGGIICGYRGIKEAFHTGKGKLVLRGVAAIEDMPNHHDRQRIVITEIPFNVNKARLVEQIADHIQEKSITGISDLRDESDREGLRIVVELKKGEMAEVVLNQLYKYCDLETTFGCQMLALDKGLPRLVNIKQMIWAWIEHRMEVIRRRSRYELGQAEARAHILEGFLKAIDRLDEVVALIRGSASKEDARVSLMQRFGFTERQAAAILELRLYQLTALEHDKISKEYQALLEKIADLKAILASEERVKGIIRIELQDIFKHYDEPRKTLITAAETEVDIEDLIAREQVAITISTDDYIKRMPIDTFREQRRGGQGVAGFEVKKEDDAIKGLYVASTHDYLLIFTTLGRLYWLKVWQIPDTGRRSKGKPLINLLEEIKPEEKIATIIQVPEFDPSSYVLMATRNGVVKKTNLSEFANQRRKGIIALAIDEGDELIAARHVLPGQEIMLFTRQGMAVRFDESEVREMGRTARGVRGVTLRKEGDGVVGCEAVSGSETLLIVCENGFGKRSKVEDFRKAHRGGVGVKSIITNERNGLVVGALSVTDSDSLLMVAEGGQTIRIRLADVRVMGRNTQGVRLAHLKETVLVAVQRVPTSGEETALPEQPVETVSEAPVEGE